MRELFGQRRESSGLDAGALAHWQRELTQQRAATVSFARSAASGRPRGGTLPPPSHELADGTPSQVSQSVTLELELVAPATRRRAPWLVAGALAVAAVSGGVWQVRGRAGAHVAAPVAAPVAIAPASEATPAPTPVIVPLVAAGPSEPPVAEPAEPAEPAREVRPHRRTRRAREAAEAPSLPPPGPDAREVEARFRAAHRAYQGFKARYGTRLESEWNDLATFATFGKQADKLSEFDRRIRAFQSRMAAVE
jgi:hypothetical protein